jgi:hypothetical protein
MLKLLQNTRINDLRLPRLVFSALALLALMSAMPVAPASAQVPADMLRLDPPQPANNDGGKLAQEHRAKVRHAYARSQKPNVH